MHAGREGGGLGTHCVGNPAARVARADAAHPCDRCPLRRSLFGRAAMCSGEELACGITSAPLQVKHKYGGQVRRRCRCRVVGSLGEASRPSPRGPVYMGASGCPSLNSPPAQPRPPPHPPLGGRRHPHRPGRHRERAPVCGLHPQAGAAARDGGRRLQGPHPVRQQPARDDAGLQAAQPARARLLRPAAGALQRAARQVAQGGQPAAVPTPRPPAMPALPCCAQGGAAAAQRPRHARTPAHPRPRCAPLPPHPLMRRTPSRWTRARCRAAAATR